MRKVAIFASEGSLLASKSHYLWIGSLYDRNTQHLGFWDPEREKNKAKWLTTQCKHSIFPWYLQSQRKIPKSGRCKMMVQSRIRGLL